MNLLMAVLHFDFKWGLFPPSHFASQGCGWMSLLQISRVVANVLNNPSRTADSGLPSTLGSGLVLTVPHTYIAACYEILQRASDLNELL
jgi:hypothetical protein